MKIRCQYCGNMEATWNETAQTGSFCPDCLNDMEKDFPEIYDYPNEREE